MLSTIEYCFPESASLGGRAYAALLELLASTPGAQRQKGAVHLSPASPPDARPTTLLSLESVEEPVLRLHGSTLADIPLSRGGSRAQERLGVQALQLEEIAAVLNGHLLWLDHSGINFPLRHLSAESPNEGLSNFLSTLGDHSALFAYPTGEPWHFIVPATSAELQHGIKDFSPGRGPRFEVVELPDSACLAIQFDLQTDLSRKEIETKLPTPRSTALPGLESYFRSVFVEHPSPGLEIRLDLRFGPGNPQGDWESGKWLVEGGRRRTGRADSECSKGKQ